MKQVGLNGSAHTLEVLIDEMGDEHVSTSAETPLREDAFELSDDEKIDRIAVHFAEIMDLLGLDRNDDSLSGTPGSENVRKRNF
jgi:GTP cyclohydrolase I